MLLCLLYLGYTRSTFTVPGIVLGWVGILGSNFPQRNWVQTL